MANVGFGWLESKAEELEGVLQTVAGSEATDDDALGAELENAKSAEQEVAKKSIIAFLAPCILHICTFRQFIHIDTPRTPPMHPDAGVSYLRVTIE